MIPDRLRKYVYYEEPDIILLHGDCLEILPHFEKDSIDLVLTDPPYGIGYIPQKHNSKQSRGNRNFGKDDMLHGDTGNLDFDPSPFLNKFPDAIHIWWGGNYYANKLPNSKGWLVWYKADGMEKTSFSHAEMAWTNIQQPIRGINHLWMGQCRASEHGQRSKHPTQKSLHVIKWSASFAPNTEIWFDPFLGSGTTAVAAKQLGRKCIGIELEQKYLDIAIERLRQEQLF